MRPVTHRPSQTLILGGALGEISVSSLSKKNHSDVSRDSSVMHSRVYKISVHYFLC